MSKKLVKITAIFSAISLNTQAFEINIETCAGVEHIRDLTNKVVPYNPTIHTFITENTPIFYIGKQHIPHIEISNRRNSTIFVTNTTSSAVSFFFTPEFHLVSSGVVSQIPNHNFSGVFNNSNNPFDVAGANMHPNTVGSINFPSTQKNSTGYAEIAWESSTCFQTSPLITSVKLDWHSPTVATASSFYYVNEGRKW